MTESDQAPAKKGLFRTPLACALLSGALAVAVSQLYGWAFRPKLTHLTSSDWIHFAVFGFSQRFLYTAVQLHGPAIYDRQGSTARRAVVLAVLFQVFVSVIGSLFSHTPATVNIVMVSVLRGSMLGVALAWLYRAKGKMGLCSILGLLGALPSAVALLVSRTPNASDETLALSSMVMYIATIIQVALPTLPIDREFRAQASANPGDAHA